MKAFIDALLLIYLNTMSEPRARTPYEDFYIRTRTDYKALHRRTRT